MNRWMLYLSVCWMLLWGSTAAMGDEIQVMFARHNAFRSQSGLAQQVLDAGLCSYAQNLADRQAAAGRMFHSDDTWPWPECVCYGAADGNHAVAMWINSGPHNAILRSRTQAVGFGFRNGFAVALFGSPVAKSDGAQAHSHADAEQCVNGSCVQSVQDSQPRVLVFSRLRQRSRFCFRGRCG